MPFRDLPANHEVRGSFCLEGLDRLRQEREAVMPFSAVEEQLFDTFRQWVSTGPPDENAAHPPPHFGTHNLGSLEINFL